MHTNTVSRHSQSFKCILLILSTLLLPIVSGAQSAKNSGPPPIGSIGLDSVKGLLEIAIDTATQAPDYTMHVANAILTMSPDPIPIPDAVTARANYAAGLAEYYRGNFLISSSYYQKAVSSAYAKADKAFQARCFNNLGINQEIIGNYEEALRAYLSSAEYCMKSQDSLGGYQTYINLGNIYSKLRDPESAEDYLQKAKRFFERIEDEYHLGLVYQNLGILPRKNNSDKRFEYLNKSRAIFSDSEYVIEEIAVTLDLVSAKLDGRVLGNIPELLARARKLIGKNNLPHLLANINFFEGRYFLEVGSYKLSFRSLQRALTLFRAVNDKDGIMHTYWHLSLLEGKNGNFDSQRIFLDSFLHHTTENFNQERANAISQYEIIFENQKREAELERVVLKLNRQRLLSYTGITGSLILLVFMTFIIIAYRRLSQKHRKIFDLNKQTVKMSPENIPARRHQEPNPEITSAAATSATSDDRDEEKFIELYNTLNTKMKTEQLYLDTNLTLDVLAYQLNTNSRYISNAIAIGFGDNYSAYINWYRINESKKLLLDPSKRKLSIDQIANYSGYSSKYTFYKQFKKHTDMTPGEFQKMARK